LVDHISHLEKTKYTQLERRKKNIEFENLGMMDRYGNGINGIFPIIIYLSIMTRIDHREREISTKTRWYDGPHDRSRKEEKKTPFYSQMQRKCEFSPSRYLKKKHTRQSNSWHGHIDTHRSIIVISMRIEEESV
jgi:hypothetical protein